MYQYIEDDGKPIVINRGDTIRKPIFVNDGDKMNPIRHELENGEWLYVAILQPNERFEDAILKQAYNVSSDKDTFGNTILDLTSMETENLQEGTYYLECKKVRYDSGGTLVPLDVKTVIHRKKFVIVE